MSLALNTNLKINFNEFILLLLSLTYAGISSDIFYGVRLVDCLLILFLIAKPNKKIDWGIISILILWFISILASTTVGIIKHNPFISSDFRFFVVFALAGYLGYSIGKNSSLNADRLFYRLMVLTIIIYCLIPFLDFLRFFYIPESFQKDEHVNTVFGPSTILINYLFIYLVLIDKKRRLTFYISYLIFGLIIYSFRISRTDLALIVIFLIWSLLYRYGDRIKLKHIVIVFVACIIGIFSFYIIDNERIHGILNPGKDSSFIYRILSNNSFIEQFWDSSIVINTFGYGMGSTITLHVSEWIGLITFTILDNGPLTVLMKSGLFGLLIFVIIILYPLKGFNIKRKLILVFPILLSMALFSHIIYNLLYIFSFYFVCYQLKSLNKSC